MNGCCALAALCPLCRQERDELVEQKASAKQQLEGLEQRIKELGCVVCVQVCNGAGGWMGGWALISLSGSENGLQCSGI